MFNMLGNALPFFLLIENGFTSLYYVKFQKAPKFPVSNFDTEYRYNVTLNLKEQI
jgi:hypothetical protein